MRQLLDRKRGVTGIGGDPGANRGRAEIHLPEQSGGLSQAVDVLLHGAMKRIELLAERHRHRVLQLGAADLEHIGEFDRLGLEGIGELLQRPHEGNGREDHGEAQRRRIGIVGRLGHIGVVDRVKKLVLAAPVAQEFQRDIGDDFIDVHIGRSASASLHRIDHELIEEESILGDEIAGAIDRIGLLRRQLLKAPIGARRRLLDKRKGADKLGKMPDWNAGDGEVFDRAQSMDAPVGRRRNFPLAEQVVLAPSRYSRKFDRARQREGEGGSCIFSGRSA